MMSKDRCTILAIVGIAYTHIILLKFLQVFALINLENSNVQQQDPHRVTLILIYTY